jgi:Uma2 family endonuclease
LVVEVLSPSTDAIDWREKLHAYRRLPALKEYALVSQDMQRVDLPPPGRRGLALHHP